MTLQPFTTTTFTVPSTLHHTSLASRFVGKWGVWLLLPVLVSLLTAVFFDYRFLFVAFIIPCVVYPMLSMMVYYDKMLRPEMRAIVFPQTVKCDAKTITVTYHHTDEDDSRRLPATMIIDCKEITSVDTIKKHMRITHNSSNGLQLLIIPLDAITYLGTTD